MDNNCLLCIKQVSSLWILRRKYNIANIANIYTYIYIYVYIYILYILYIYIYVYILYIYICIYIYIYIFAIFIYIYIYMYMCIYIFIIIIKLSLLSKRCSISARKWIECMLPTGGCFTLEPYTMFKWPLFRYLSMSLASRTYSCVQD